MIHRLQEGRRNAAKQTGQATQRHVLVAGAQRRHDAAQPHVLDAVQNAQADVHLRAPAGEHGCRPPRIQHLPERAACQVLQPLHELLLQLAARQAFRCGLNLLTDGAEFRCRGSVDHLQAVFLRQCLAEHLAVQHAQVHQPQQAWCGGFHLLAILRLLLTQHTGFLQLAHEYLLALTHPGFVEFVGEQEAFMRCQCFQALVLHEPLVNFKLSLLLRGGQLREDFRPFHAGEHFGTQ